MSDPFVEQRIDELLPMVRKAEGSSDTDISTAGAIGRYQILPSTALSLGHDPSPQALMDPGYNEQVARSALGDLIRQHGPNDTKAILAGYNASPAAVNKWKMSGRNDAVLPEETQNYFKSAGVEGAQPTFPYKPIDGPVGKKKFQTLIDAGVPLEQAQEWQRQTAQALREGGVPENKIAEYFGASPVEADLPTPENKKTPSIFDQLMQPYSADPQKSVETAFSKGFSEGFQPEAPILSTHEDVLTAETALQKVGLVPTKENLNVFNAMTGTIMNLGVPVALGAKDAFLLAGRITFGVIHGGVDAVAQVMKNNGMDEWSANRFARDVKGGIDLELARGGEVPAMAAASDVQMAAGQIGGVERMGHLVGPARRVVPSKLVEDLTPNVQKIYEDNGVHPAALASVASNDAVVQGEVISRMADGTMHTPSIDAENAPSVEDTRGQGQQYHGSPTPISKPSNGYYNENNIYGATGFYTTDAKDIAKGYKRKSDQGVTYKVSEVAPVKMFDMEEKKSPEEWNKIFPNMKDDDLFQSALENVSPKANLREVMNEMRQSSAGEGLSKIDTQELFDRMTENLHDSGFGGMQHVGGLLTNKKPHQVKIYFRPEDQLKLTKEPDAIVPDEALKYRLDQVGEHNYEMPLPETYGSRNTIVTTEAADAIRAKLRDKFKTQMSAGLDPEILALGAKLAAYHVEAGVREIGALGKKIAEDLGTTVEKIQPYLQSWHEQATKDIPDIIAGGTSPPKKPPNGFSYGNGGGEAPKGPLLSQGELERRIDNFIGEKPAAPKPWWNPKTMYRQYITELANAPALDKALGTDPKLMGVEDQLRQTYASSGRVGYWVRYGTLKLDRNKAGEITYKELGGPSMLAAFEKARLDGGSMDGLIRYWVSARALALTERGIESGLDPYVARKYIEATHPLYHDALKMLQENDFSVIDYGRDSGIFSRDGAAAMKQLNPFHLVFQRVIEPSYNSPGRAFGPRQPVKMIEGSERQIIPPIPAKINNMHTIVAMADRNIAVTEIVNAITKREHNLPSESRSLILKETYDVPALRDNVHIIDEDGNAVPPADKETITPFIAMQKFFGSKGPNDFIQFVDGVPKIWTAKDPETALMLRAVQPGPEAHAIVKIAEGFANIGRLGIVSLPDFPVRTAMRSQFEAAIRAEHTGIPGYAWIHGAWEAFGQGPMFGKFMKDGGFGAAIVDIDGKYIQRDIDAIFNKTGTWDRIWNVFRHPLDTLHAIRQMSENAPRVGYWKNAIADGMSGPKAAMESRKAYGDNAEKAGLAAMNTWAKTTMFMRPSVLDVHYLAQAMKIRPGHVVMAGASLVTLPTVMNFIANKMYDDGKEDNIDYRMAHPEYIPYSEMPRWQKDMMLVTPPVLAGAVRARLPVVPYTGGFLFHTLAERFLSYAYDHDPRAFKDWGATFMAQFAPPLMPALALPLYEEATNSHGQSPAPLIPSSMEGLSGYMQYTPNTSNTAKKIAQIVGPIGTNLGDVSALTLDNYIRDWSGPVPTNIMRVLDGTLKQDPRPWEIASLPFVTSFVTRHPNAGAQPIEDFYDTLAKYEAKHKDLTTAMKRGDFLQLSAQMQVPGAMMKYQKLDQLRTALGKNAQVIRTMDANGDMTNDEKLKFTDKMFTTMSLTAKAGLRVLDSMPGR